MRWMRISAISTVSFLLVASGSFFKQSFILLLCSLITFNTVTCRANFGDTSRANAVTAPSNNEINQSLTDTSQEQEVADVCLFNLCAPIDLPDPIENIIEDGLNDVAEQQIRSLFVDEIPIQGSEHEFYENVDILPGEAFAPQLLPLSALSPDTPIPLGDYEIPAHFYCTKVYSFDGRGNRFPLARLDGRMSDVLSALYTRASYDSSVSTSEIQELSWAIQTGISYNELSDSQQVLVDRLIPDYRDRMESNLVDRFTGIVNDASRISGNRLPGVNEILNDLGPVGDVAGSLLQARQQILQTNYGYQALAQEFAPQQDVFLDGGTEETPWSRTRENVYMRFIAPDGALDDGTIQVRILDNHSGLSKSGNRSTLVASLPLDGGIPSSSTSSITAGDLTQDITSSVGVPESSGHQAITATPLGKEEVARLIAQALSNDTGWKDTLPPCPCTEAEAANSVNFARNDIGLEEHHPGAVAGYRSKNPMPYVLQPSGLVLRPGQQCTYDAVGNLIIDPRVAPYYDAEGNLITDPAAAGTPDAYAPDFNPDEPDLIGQLEGALTRYNHHYVWDILPSKFLSGEEYRRIWSPSVGDIDCPLPLRREWNQVLEDV